MPGMLLRDVALASGQRVDLRVSDGVIAELDPRLPGGENGLDCAGRRVLPGLHDHHLHLGAMVAAARSVHCGPPVITDAPAFAAALRAAPAVGGWVRGVGYYESVCGSLDRNDLDAIRSDACVRVQHRSGALWYLNTAAVRALELGSANFAGIERDSSGRPTGRLWRSDQWLGTRLAGDPSRSREQLLHGLASVSQRLASYGVTGVTDATPTLDADAVSLFVQARESVLRQRLTVLGTDRAPSELIRIGPCKVVVPDHDLPSLDALVAQLVAGRGPSGARPVAVHCVTRAALWLTLVALREIGALPGDRIEHAAVTPPDAAAEVARLGLSIVTQPSFVALRGDEYLRDVEPDDQQCLWPFKSLLDAGIPVGCSSDAPYGDPDPWASIRAASRRLSPTGQPVCGAEAVPAEQALAGYLSAPDDPGGAPRVLKVGAPADFVVVDARSPGWPAEASAEDVWLTVIAGEIAYQR